MKLSTETVFKEPPPVKRAATANFSFYHCDIMCLQLVTTFKPLKKLIIIVVCLLSTAFFLLYFFRCHQKLLNFSSSDVIVLKSQNTKLLKAKLRAKMKIWMKESIASHEQQQWQLHDLHARRPPNTTNSHSWYSKLTIICSKADTLHS